MKKYVTALFLGLILLASSWALLNPQFFRTHDYVHGVRIAEMTHALNQGQFPVRWSANLGFGMGMPLFEFYGPLPYYVGSLFYWLGFSLVTSTKLLYLVANLSTIWGAYLLGKKMFKNRWAGILVAAALTLAPYRAVNLFIRGAVGEAWGIMAMPWILYSLVSLIDQAQTKIKKQTSWLLLTISILTLILSHNLSTLMFLPFSILFGAGYLWLKGSHQPWQAKFWQHNLKLILTLAGAYLLAFGLGSFYFLPAFFEKEYTQLDTILSGYFHYSNHFLYIRQFFKPNWGFGGSAWGPDDDISFFLGWGQLLGLAVATVSAGWLLLTKNRRQYFRQIWLTSLLIGLMGGGLLLTLLKTQFLWDRVSLLAFIQFPWRFMTVGTVFLSVLAGMGYLLLGKLAAGASWWQTLKSSVTFKERRLKINRANLFKLGVLKFLPGLYFVVMFNLLIWGNFYYFRPEKFMDVSGWYYDDPDRTAYQMSDILRDYVPNTMPLDGEEIKDWKKNWTFPEGTQTIIDQGDQKLYQFELPEAAVVEFPVAWFPGWQIEVDGQSQPDITLSSGARGLATADLPAGRHQVGIFWGETPIRLTADIISAISLIILLIFSLKLQILKK